MGVLTLDFASYLGADDATRLEGSVHGFKEGLRNRPTVLFAKIADAEFSGITGHGYENLASHPSGSRQGVEDDNQHGILL